MNRDIVETSTKGKGLQRRTYSMQFRFWITVILAMFAVAVIIGGLSIYEINTYVKEQSEDFVRATCENEGAQINDSFGDMEKSVRIMESYVTDFFTAETDLTDRAFQERVLQSADNMFVDVAKHTSGAVAYYVRFDPSISDGKTGLFYSKLNGSDEYTAMEVTDLSLYDRDDTEHVGWFWQPYDAGEAVWMTPYYNRNNGILMISYVVPMYCEGRFIGVVGMDFDYHILMERVHSIRVYENGFAHLELNGVVVHAEGHDDAEDVTEHPEKYLRESKELVNGMTLVVSASLKDIRQIDREIVRNILLAVLFLSALFALVVFLAVKRIVEPLKKLTAASEKLSNGEYNVEHVYSNTREIRLLSVAFEHMAVRLREREGILHRSAYRDTLTGLRNTTSCKARVEEFEKNIRNHQADFGVVVLDINELKNANDLHGHDVGNELIVSSAKIISNVFKHSPVFRIGGDEFLVVLQNSDLANREILFEQFERNCAQSLVNETARISVRIALGFARFEAGKDQCFADVFKRADEAMYRNKRTSKMGRD